MSSSQTGESRPEKSFCFYLVSTSFDLRRILLHIRNPKKPLFRKVPVEECIRTVAATYGCKILQLYEYDANVYGYDANCE